MSGYKERMELLEKQRRSQKSYYDRACDWFALRVARQGAIALDAAKPGSVGRLDLAKLNIRSPVQCALGQTYGHIKDAPAHLRKNAPGFGFAPSTHYRYRIFFLSDFYINCDHLTEAWRKVAREYGAAPA